MFVIRCEQELLSFLGKSKESTLVYNFYMQHATKINQRHCYDKYTISKEHHACYSTNFSIQKFSIVVWYSIRMVARHYRQLGSWPPAWLETAAVRESAPPLLKGSESMQLLHLKYRWKTGRLVEHNFIDETQINYNWYPSERVSRSCCRTCARRSDRVGGQCLKSAEFTR
jgi:hypothetical protein